VQARSLGIRYTSSLTRMRPNPDSPSVQAAFPLVIALWWACQDLNLGPHPYQQNAGNAVRKALSAGHARPQGSGVLS
jgi:hypothetical protein